MKYLWMGLPSLTGINRIFIGGVPSQALSQNGGGPAHTGPLQSSCFEITPAPIAQPGVRLTQALPILYMAGLNMMPIKQHKSLGGLLAYYLFLTANLQA